MMKSETDTLFYGINFRRIRISFRVALIVAIFLHIIALFIYAQNYKPEVIEVPFKILHIKIGNIDSVSNAVLIPGPKKITAKPEQKPVQEKPANKDLNISPVKKTIQKPKEARRPQKKAEDKPVLEPLEIIQPKNKEAEKAEKKQNKVVPLQQAQKEPSPEEREKKIAKKGVQEKEGMFIPEAGGSKLGNEKMASQLTPISYEQALSLWIFNHMIYPEEAKKQGVEGIIIARLRIDRKGNILYYELLKATGHKLLDEAAKQVIENSNPVPPIPLDYPVKADNIEFDIPLKFEMLKSN